MIDELVEYKKTHFPDDKRRIITCGGTSHSTIRVEWLPLAAPGVDPKGEVQLFGMVRRMSRHDALLKIASVKMQLGMV
jgi:hypothetical protein